MNLDAETLEALGYSDILDVRDEGGERRLLWGLRVFGRDHKRRAPKPKLVSAADSQRRYRAKLDPSAEAARMRTQRAGWSDERREHERQKVRERRAKRKQEAGR